MGLSAGLSILALAIFGYPFGITAVIGVIGSIGVSINAASGTLSRSVVRDISGAAVEATERSGGTITLEYTTVGDCGTGLCPSSNFLTDRITEEQTDAIYLQFNHDRQLGNVMMNGEVVHANLGQIER